MPKISLRLGLLALPIVLISLTGCAAPIAFKPASLFFTEEGVIPFAVINVEPAGGKELIFFSESIIGRQIFKTKDPENCLIKVLKPEQGCTMEMEVKPFEASAGAIYLLETNAGYATYSLST